MALSDKISRSIEYRTEKLMRRSCGKLAEFLMTYRKFSSKNLPVRNICLIAFMDGYGNAILLEPTLRKLRTLFPEAKIFLVGSKHYREIFGTTNLVDQISIGEPYFDNFSLWLRKLRKQKIDTIIECYPWKCHGFQKLSLILNFPRLWIGRSSGKNRAFTGLHEVDENLSALSFGTKVAMTEVDREPKISPSEGELIEAESLIFSEIDRGVPIVGIHLGSGINQHWKRWEPENFAELSQKICDRWDATIVIFGGPDDQKLSDRFLEKFDGDKVIDFTGKSKNFRTTLAMISLCDLFVAGDTGLMNGANAVGIPLIALFGPTHRGKSEPIGAKNRLCVISLELPCQPCYIVGAKGFPAACPHRDCMKNLTAEIVWHRSKDFIGKAIGAKKDKRQGVNR